MPAGTTLPLAIRTDQGSPEPSLARYSRHDEADPTRLTGREIEVMTLVASGLYNHEIATRLSIAEATVRAHLRSVLSKTDARCRTEAVMTGLQDGWLSCPRNCLYKQFYTQNQPHVVRWGGTA